MERILTLELFGEQHKFQADADDTNAEAIVHYLEQKVEDAGRKMASPGRDVNKFAQLLLAAMNISHEYFEMKGKYDRMLRSVEKRSEDLVSKIDKNVKKIS